MVKILLHDQLLQKDKSKSLNLQKHQDKNKVQKTTSIYNHVLNNHIHKAMILS